MQVVILDGKLDSIFDTRADVEAIFKHQYAEHYVKREFNMQLDNEWFFKLSPFRLVSVYEVDGSLPVYMLAFADGWVAKVSNSFMDMQVYGRRIALRGVKRRGVPEGWMIRRLSDNIQLVVTK